MTDLAGYYAADPATLEKGDDILLVRPETLGEADPIPAKFFGLAGPYISVGLAGSSTGIPFPDDEWDIWVQKEYPLPDKRDIAMLIANAVQHGIAGAPKTFDEIAEEIASLIKGDIAPGVEPWRAPEVVAEMPEMPEIELQVPVDETHPDFPTPFD